MNITNIESREIIVVTTDTGVEYTRHSADCWMQTYGMSEETVQDTTEIESAYQEFIKPSVEDIDLEFKLMSEHLRRMGKLSNDALKFYENEPKEIAKVMQQFTDLPDKEYRKVEKQVMRDFDEIRKDFMAKQQEDYKKLDAEFIERGYNPRMTVSEFSKLMEG